MARAAPSPAATESGRGHVSAAAAAPIRARRKTSIAPAPLVASRSGRRSPPCPCHHPPRPRTPWTRSADPRHRWSTRALRRRTDDTGGHGEGRGHRLRAGRSPRGRPQGCRGGATAPSPRSCRSRDPSRRVALVLEMRPVPEGTSAQGPRQDILRVLSGRRRLSRRRSATPTRCCRVLRASLVARVARDSQITARSVLWRTLSR